LEGDVGELSAAAAEKLCSRFLATSEVAPLFTGLLKKESILLGFGGGLGVCGARATAGS